MIAQYIEAGTTSKVEDAVDQLQCHMYLGRLYLPTRYLTECWLLLEARKLQHASYLTKLYCNFALLPRIFLRKIFRRLACNCRQIVRGRIPPAHR